LGPKTSASLQTTLAAEGHLAEEQFLIIIIIIIISNFLKNAFAVVKRSEQCCGPFQLSGTAAAPLSFTCDASSMHSSIRFSITKTLRKRILHTTCFLLTALPC
jgi:hypothetical protein